MRCFLNLLAVGIALVPLCGIAALAQTPAYNLGKTPSEEEVRAWDLAIGPAGKELPPGSGTPQEGAKVFAQKCAGCHGPTATEAKFKHGPLVGGQGTFKGPLETMHPERSIGSFWPFATTVWDYINRSMPRGQEGSLSAAEVYAVTAWILWRNGIIPEDAVMDAKSLPKVQMPNRNGFDPPRPEYKPEEPRPYGFHP